MRSSHASAVHVATSNAQSRSPHRGYIIRCRAVGLHPHQDHQDQTLVVAARGAPRGARAARHRHGAILAGTRGPVRHRCGRTSAAALARRGAAPRATARRNAAPPAGAAA
eukprot:scaffold31278_cov74-Phaeocystis_antarctica.AAC.5